MISKKVIASIVLVAGLAVGFFVLRGVSVGENGNASSVGASDKNAARAQRESRREKGLFAENSVSDTKPLVLAREEISEAELSGELKILLGLTDEPASYADRAKVLRGLYGNKSLSDDELLALRSLLEFALSEFPDMRPIEANALKNDVLALLLEQEALPVGISDQVVDMFNNPEHDPMWQEYCAQFFPVMWEKLNEHRISNSEHSTLNQESSQSVSSAESEDALQEAMVSALDRRDETLAGTALIGLELLSRDHEEFDREMITEKASEIAADSLASTANRMTAMRMASLLENEDVLPATRMLAQTGETILMQCAAITTLGDFGAPEDRELLTALSQSSNKQIASAAQTALGRSIINHETH